MSCDFATTCVDSTAVCGPDCISNSRIGRWYAVPPLARESFENSGTGLPLVCLDDGVEGSWLTLMRTASRELGYRPTLLPRHAYPQHHSEYPLLRAVRQQRVQRVDLLLLRFARAHAHQRRLPRAAQQPAATHWYQHRRCLNSHSHSNNDDRREYLVRVEQCGGKRL